MTGRKSNGRFGPWGNVPVDGDVTPFTMGEPVRDGGDRSNRKHHFVSVTYMDGFTDDRGRVQVYRAEEPEKPHPTQPSATGYERQYYSQPLPEGGHEHHSFEDLWSCVEAVWPQTVRALLDRRLSPAISINVLGMVAIMRVRVPAARDSTTIMLEAKLRSECQAIEAIGKLPAEYGEYANRLDAVPIGIPPQRTLLAMNENFREMGNLCFRLGFEVLHNRTETPFLTSDNPVCYYDPRRTPSARRPYEDDGEVELIFPISAKLMLRGSTKRRPVNGISRHRTISDAHAVRRLNRTVAQFAYRMSIAQDRSSDDLVRAHAALVPTVRTDVSRNGKKIDILVTEVFAPRPKLSQFIDTPEKAARLQASMEAEGFFENDKYYAASSTF
jgi:hypothetical protein